MSEDIKDILFLLERMTDEEVRRVYGYCFRIYCSDTALRRLTNNG